MREFIENYWVSITLVLCTMALLAVEILIFPLYSEWFGVGYIILMLVISLVAFASDSCDERAFKTFVVLSFIAPFLQMGMLMYLFPTEVWFPVISGGLLSCIGGPYLAYAVPSVRLLKQLQRDLRKQILSDAEQFRIEHEAFLAQLKQRREQEEKKKKHSYCGKPVRYVRSKIIRVDEESGGYMIYLEQDNISYYIFKHWLKRKGKKMLSAPKVGHYATLYFSGPENSSVVACYIGGKCRYKADGFEEY